MVAQQPAPPAQASQPPLTLRVNARLVEVSVVVKDSHGNPVTDLRPSDFELYDRGKKQEIRVFQVEAYHPAGGQPPAAPAPPAPRSLTAGAFSNRTPPQPGAPNAPTVILIDVGNTWDRTRMTWQDLVYAREQLIRFLRQVHPEDRLGIYLMGEDRFWVLHEYTQSCTDLLDRLASWKGNAGPEPVGAKYRDVWTEFAVRLAGVDAETARAIHRSQFWGVNAARSSALPDNLQEAPGDQNGNFSDGGMISVPRTGPASGEGSALAVSKEMARRQDGMISVSGTYLPSDASSPLAVLQAVARHLAPVPGRKNVILISGKMFLPSESRQDQIQVLRAIVQTGVAIYTIDPGGLAPYDLDASFVIPSWVTANAPNPTRAALEYIGRAYDWKRQLTLYLQSSLTALAEATGGQVFVNTNDVLGAIRSSFDDSRVTYTLGFYPSASNDDGSFHPLKVKLPGRRLTVRYRAGYFEPEAPARDPLRREAELRQAVWSPVDASAIELSGTASPATGSHDYELKLSIGLAAVSLQPDGDRWSGQIEVILVQRDNFGNEYEPLSQELGLKLKQESYDQAVRSGLPYDRSFRLNPKATSLRAVVRDLNSGNLGTLTIPLPASAP